MTRYAILGTLAAVIGTVLLLEALLTFGHDEWLALVLLGGGIAVWSLLFFAKANRNPFTPDQMKHIQELVQRERVKIKTLKQQIIDEGAEAGKTISTDNILKKLDTLKASHSGPDRDLYVAYLDKVAKEFRENYGSTIPVDVAYKLLTDYEEKNGPLED
jgi:hypothetical protein